MSVFGLKYYSEIDSKYQDVLWRVEIAERNFDGEAEKVLMSASSPITVTWESKGDDFFVPIKGSEAGIVVFCTENFKFKGLFTADPRKYRVSILRDGELYWRGFLVSDTHSEPLSPPPYNVALSAVDGFSILSNYPYVGLGGVKYTGHQSLLQIVSSCVDLLDLDMDINDMLDMSAVGMDEYISTLNQTYIDIDRVYAYYKDPTYRDLLEICLRPFAAQIFQSGGKINIRRIASMKEYTSIQSLFLETQSGEVITTQSGEIIVPIGGDFTDSANYRKMWGDGIHTLDSADLSVVPALRNISVPLTVTTTLNIFDQLDVYNLENWDDEDNILYSDGSTLLMSSKSAAINSIATIETYLEQSSYELAFSFAYECFYLMFGFEETVPGSVTVKFGFKLLGDDDQTYYMAANGEWTTEESELQHEMTSGAVGKFDITLNPLPTSGTLQFYIVQTLTGSNGGQRVWLSDLSLAANIDDDQENIVFYDNSYTLNPANNTDMKISIPFADMYDIPNAPLLYPLYFKDENFGPTYSWKVRGEYIRDSLVGHLVSQAVMFNGRPTHKINGGIYSGVNMSLNTLLLDDKYLNMAFYVNSLSVDPLVDRYDAELVELPNYVISNDDDTNTFNLLRTFDGEIKQVVSCSCQLIILLEGGDVVAYDPILSATRTLLTDVVRIHPANNLFVAVQANYTNVVNLNGSIIKRFALDEEYMSWATYLSDKLYYIGEFLDSFDDHYRSELVVYGTDYPRQRVTSNHCLRSRNTIVIADQVFDARVDLENVVRDLDITGEIIAVSDKYFATTSSLYSRPTSSTEELVKEVQTTADATHAAVTDSTWAYVSGNTMIVDTNLDDSGGVAVTLPDDVDESSVHGVFFLFGAIYLAQGNSIYKYVE